jgi:putative solute:sodium symporter small subunit
MSHGFEADWRAKMVKRSTLLVGAMCWLGIGCLIHAAAPTLNGVKWGALPLGFWIAAQGAPLILGVLACWLMPNPGAKTDAG